jgi:hypothetical protein
MPTDYVEDYEELTGKKREKFKAETKVVTPPDDTPIFNATEAETKAK